MILSPLDWALMEQWQKQEIPLKIVLRSIENVFDVADKNPHRTRSIKSLAFCKEEVEAQFGEWLQAQVGKSGKAEQGDSDEKYVREAKPQESKTLFSTDAILKHLDGVQLGIEQSNKNSVGEMQEVLEKVSAKLDDLKKTRIEAETIEKSLSKLDRTIDKALVESAENDLLNRVKAVIEKALDGHRSKMEPEAYEKTFELMLIKKLREEHGIPNLSLFYL